MPTDSNAVIAVESAPPMRPKVIQIPHTVHAAGTLFTNCSHFSPPPKRINRNVEFTAHYIIRETHQLRPINVKSSFAEFVKRSSIGDKNEFAWATLHAGKTRYIRSSAKMNMIPSIKLDKGICDW